MSDTPTKKVKTNPSGTMFLVKSTFMKDATTGVENFTGIPASKDCPFVELIYDPANKILGIISPYKKETFQDMIKVDNNGMPKPNTNKAAREKLPFQQERVMMETYHEYYVRDPKEIDAFLKMHVINVDFNWNTYFK